MAFCSKCGSKLAEGTKFCSSCGTPVTQSDTGKGTQPDSDQIKAAVTQLADSLSLTPKLLGAAAGFALVFLYYFICYLGAWTLSFWTFLTNLLAPALFAGLILAKFKNNGKLIYFSIPFGLRGLCALIFLLRNLTTMSFQGWAANLAYISLAILFVMTMLGKFNGKKIMLGISAAAGVFLTLLSFRYGFLNGLLPLVYFGSVFALITELNFPEV